MYLDKTQHKRCTCCGRSSIMPTPWVTIQSISIIWVSRGQLAYSKKLSASFAPVAYLTTDLSRKLIISRWKRIKSAPDDSEMLSTDLGPHAGIAWLQGASWCTGIPILDITIANTNALMLTHYVSFLAQWALSEATRPLSVFFRCYRKACAAAFSCPTTVCGWTKITFSYFVCGLQCDRVREIIYKWWSTVTVLTTPSLSVFFRYSCRAYLSIFQ